uniref:Uncharacterized protein n=1 Tax=Lutzomyia longipalpis TaxID=7200 RepID=A0A1B0CL24_LUTLO
MMTDSLFGNAIKKEPEKIGSSGAMLPVGEDATKPVFTVMDLGKMLLLSAKEGNTPQVRELMTKGAPFSTDWLGTSPLHLAAMNNHLDTCEVLIRAGLNKDARTKVDRTPLHFAVYEGHEQIVELLVANQCDVDARDMLRMTPLHWAVEKRHRRIVEILLRHGADPSAESKFRKTPTSMALEHGYNDIYLMLDAAFRVRLENPEHFQRPPPAATNLHPDVKSNGRTATVVQEAIDVINTPSPPINSSSIDEDNGMTLSDAIIRLQTIDDTRSINPSSTLQMLKDHGISMLPTEDTENAFISSALQGGRKLVLSEAGKLMMNETKARRSTSQMPPGGSTSRLSISPASVKPLKPPNKVIKIVTAEEFKRMLSGDLSATKKVQLKANGAMVPAKQRRQMLLSRRPELLPAATDIFAESDSCRIKPNQVPNLLDIHAEEAPDTDLDDYTADLDVLAVPDKSPSPRDDTKGNLPTAMGLSEIEKQLLDLKKQTEELRRQLEISQRQNEEYKVRLEKLEQEKELERRQRSHINS